MAELDEITFFFLQIGAIMTLHTNLVASHAAIVFLSIVRQQSPHLTLP